MFEMKKISVSCVLALAAILVPCQCSWILPERPDNIYGFYEKNCRGSMIPMDRYTGLVLLFINIAPVDCPYSPMFLVHMNHLHTKYHKAGFRVLAFPTDEFGCDNPESIPPGDGWYEGLEFKFELFGPVQVNSIISGDRLWTYFRTVTGNLFYTHKIVSNNNMIIVNRRGVVVERLTPDIKLKDLELLILSYL